MMGISEQLETLELNMADAKYVLELKKALDNLATNKDWQLLIEKEFFGNEAARFVSLKSAVHMQSDAQQRFVDGGIIGIGTLQQFIVKVKANSIEAEKVLIDGEEAFTVLSAMEE